jgi:hypothetical protein
VVRFGRVALILPAAERLDRRSQGTRRVGLRSLRQDLRPEDQSSGLLGRTVRRLGDRGTELAEFRGQLSSSDAHELAKTARVKHQVGNLGLTFPFFTS